MRIIIYLLILLFVSCNKAKYIENYYPDGSLMRRIEVNDSNIANGIYEEYYPSGEVKIKGSYVNGTSLDTIYQYYKNGNIKEKGLLKDKMKTGWWSEYDSLGVLKRKVECIAIGRQIHENQKINFDKYGDTILRTSSFFRLNIPDTIILGKNKCSLKYNSNIYKNVRSKFLDIIIDNQMSENKIVRDTFVNEPGVAIFGVFAYKKGLMKVKGTIIEKIIEVEEVGKDSAIMTKKNHTKYFSRNVYIK